VSFGRTTSRLSRCRDSARVSDVAAFATRDGREQRARKRCGS